MTRFHFRMRALAAAGLLSLLAGGLCLTVFSKPSAEPGDRSESELLDAGSRAARILSQVLPRAHLNGRPMDTTIAERALDLFLDSLDFDRTYFTAADVDEFRRELPRLGDMLKSGDLAFAFRVHERFMERVRNRGAYVDTLLDGPTDTSTDETYPWKRREAARAADEAEWNDLWRRKIKNEYVARLVAVEMAPSEDDKKKDAKDAQTDAPSNDPDEMEKNVVTSTEDRKDLHLTPEAFIRKRYRQFQTVLEDNDEEMVIDRFLTSFTQAYDPHSDYMTAARTEDFDISMRLSLVGIGAQLSSEDGAAKIERLIPGGPAEQDGRLQVGDRIIAVGQGDEDSVDTLHWPLYKVVRLIRGEKDTRVTLVIWPASDVSGATERRITLTRDEVKLEEQAARKIIHEMTDADGHARKLGIIKLPEFYADFKARGEEPRRSASDVRRLLLEMVVAGVDGIALDLRNNGGGSLPDAIEIAGLFIESGPIVQVRDARAVQAINDPDPGVAYDGPLVVLVSRISASASEIVAAALQDYGRAVVIGDRKTHGKGTVQTLLPLNPKDESVGSVKVTSASFYRIGGGSTQVKGVAADIIIPSFFDAMEIGEEFLPHALPWTMVDPANYTMTPAQIPPLDILRDRSAARRAELQAFRIRDQMVERLGRRMSAETVPLNLNARLATAREEKELDAAQRDASGTKASEETNKKSDEEDDNPSGDIVLIEALNVLVDIAAWRESKPGEPVFVRSDQ